MNLCSKLISDDDQKDSGIGMSPRPTESDEDDQDPDNKYGIMV